MEPVEGITKGIKFESTDMSMNSYELFLMVSKVLCAPEEEKES